MQSTRVLPTLLFGAGVALVVGGLVAPQALLVDARLPLDLENTTWTISDPEGTRDGKPAPVVRQLHLEVRNPSDEDTASVRIGDTLRAGAEDSDFDNLVSASTWAYRLDRVSGEARETAQVQLVMAMPAVEVPVDGVWLKFPVDVKRQDYDVFDPALRGTAPAQFVGSEKIDGREVYRFSQEIAPTNLAQRYADDRNTAYVEGPEGEQQRAFLFHSAKRELAVDKVTGIVVGIDEKVDDFYGDARGRGLQNVVTYDAHADEDQMHALLAELDGVDPESRARTIGWVVTAVGGVLALVGLLLAVRRRRR